MEEKMKMIPEERLNELLSILLPYGYSKKGNRYTGVSISKEAEKYFLGL